VGRRDRTSTRLARGDRVRAQYRSDLVYRLCWVKTRRSSSQQNNYRNYDNYLGLVSLLVA